ncbi:prepilin-type N-terminal cleavage/methylation domain-containing protein [Actinoplanes sp. CA-015351]|uniref:prepilin-type N-terminal cleavage/methylation domain-containing protein n=1 Tax=Actinoplanes sp. CA-015351 TaxID=3239897 RepID=UPI003D9518E6
MQDVIAKLRAKKADEGFTLIELLVVVVIIGVLVAIAVPVYLNYRQGAADKSAQSDVRGAISAVEQYYTNNGNTYPTAQKDQTNTSSATASLTLTKQTGGTDGVVTLSDKTQLSYVPNGTSAYLICANNTGGSGKWYVYDSSTGGSVKTASTTLTLTTCK